MNHTHILDEHQSDPWSIFKEWQQNATGASRHHARDKFFYPLRLLMRKLYPPFAIHAGEAMVLATASSEGVPSARVVLFKELWDGGVVFYTNYQSRKSQELLSWPHAALVFHWSLPERQVRMEGIVKQVPEEISDRYWHSRPRSSQIGGWASEQSHPLKNRSELLSRVEEWERKWNHQPVPRPPHWGGFVLRPQRMEFWEACGARLHRRRLYEQKEEGHWQSHLLFP